MVLQCFHDAENGDITFSKEYGAHISVKNIFKYVQK